MNRSQTFRRCWLVMALTLAMSISGALLAASTAHAQVSVEGHAVLAVGGYSNQFASANDNELATGGEILFLRRVGVSAEVGLVAFGGRTSPCSIWTHGPSSIILRGLGSHFGDQRLAYRTPRLLNGGGPSLAQRA